MEKDKSMDDLKNKLKNLRSIYPDFSDNIYALADYMALIVEDDMSPKEIAYIMPSIVNDILLGKCSTNSEIKLPKYLLDNQLECIGEVKKLPQVFDVIGDSSFADKIREYCDKIFEYRAPKIDKKNISIKYPDYIEAALNWWVKTIQTPNINTSNNFLEILSLTFPNKSYSKEEIEKFRNILGNSIKKEIETFGECNINVQYSPCTILQNACDAIGVSNVSYPAKMNMKISCDEVVVENKMEMTKKIIWSEQEIKEYQRIKKYSSIK